VTLFNLNSYRFETIKEGMRMRILKFSFAAAALAISLVALLTGSTSASSRVVSSAADGAALFSSKCALCHDKTGAGKANWKAKGQPDLRDANWQRDHSDGQIADVIRNGKAKFMPSFKGKLSDEDINAVVAHIRTLKKK
jgi:mono/diheme cytochrome c family protein